MRRLHIHWGLICAFLSSTVAGCIIHEENCAYYETECWDVVDVVCDPWGCWEEYLYTECQDYCVGSVSPDPLHTDIDCTLDRHCLSGEVCSGERCVPESAPPAGSGLCQTCDVNRDCIETGALCLNLTSDATLG
jgi:hypothetical protein